MRLPRITMTWFFFGSPDLPSIRVPARITVTETCGAFCAPVEFAALKAAITAPSQARISFCMMASAFLFFYALFQSERYRDTLLQREFQTGLCAIISSRGRVSLRRNQGKGFRFAHFLQEAFNEQGPGILWRGPGRRFGRRWRASRRRSLVGRRA